MFFVLLNEDQTPGFLAKALPPSPFPLGAQGQQRLKDRFYLKRAGFFFSLPLLFPSLLYTPPLLLPLPPLLSLISLSGTQSVSAPQSEFISFVGGSLGPDESGL